MGSAQRKPRAPVVQLRPDATPTEQTRRSYVAQALDRFERWWPSQPAAVKNGIRRIVGAEKVNDAVARHREAGVRVLEFMNRKRHKPGRRGFPINETNLKLVCRLLDDPRVTEQDLRAMLAVKWRQVERGEFKDLYYRPKTLFNPTNSSNYIGEVGGE